MTSIANVPLLYLRIREKFIELLEIVECNGLSVIDQVTSYWMLNSNEEVQDDIHKVEYIEHIH